MSKWFMMTLVGEDNPGMVAHIASALYEGGCNLGETSMTQLGGNIAMVMLLQFDGRRQALAEAVQTVVDSFGLHMHIDVLASHPARMPVADVRVSVSGADRPGILAKVTAALSEVGLHILKLYSSVSGSEQAPVYCMHIEGEATEGVAGLQSAVDIINQEGMDVSLSVIPVAADP
jgi:glycine cleavage system transcriptional repressor